MSARCDSVVNELSSILPNGDATTLRSATIHADSLMGDSATYRRNGRMRKLSPKKAMLTKRATITRACSASSLSSKTHPVTEGCRVAQRVWNASAERVAARPQENGIEQRYPHWPHENHCERRRVGKEGLEDPRRCARQHEKGEREREGQDTSHTAEDRCLGTTRCGTIVRKSAILQQLPANKAECKDQYEADGPQRTQQQAPAIVAQTRAWNKDILKLGRQLKEVYPPGVLLQTQRRHHIEDARHCGDALAEPNEQQQERSTPDRCGPSSGSAAVVAECAKLVKVPGVGRPGTQLAPRPTVAVVAVAVAIVARLSTTNARAPRAVSLATIWLRRRCRVPPVALCQRQSCDSAIGTAASADEGVAHAAIGGGRTGVRTVVA
eukprot:7390540-Prymnesium_polylepis.3